MRVEGAKIAVGTSFPGVWMGVDAICAIGRAVTDRALEVTCGAEILQGLAPQGSAALGGISLTVVAVRPAAFAVPYRSHTWEHTALKFAHTGTVVNWETDLIGKYVQRHVADCASAPKLTLE